MDCMEPMITKWVALTIYQATTTHTRSTTPPPPPTTTTSPTSSSSSSSHRPLFIFESNHFPYAALPYREKIIIPGADQIRITFDPLCHTAPNLDYLSFYAKDDLLTSSSPKYSFSGSRFQSFEFNHTDRFSFSFEVDKLENNPNTNTTNTMLSSPGTGNGTDTGGMIMNHPHDKYYGWKFYVYATFPNQTLSHSLHSSSISSSSFMSLPSTSIISSPAGVPHGSSSGGGGGGGSVGLSDISFYNDSMATFDNLESFCFALISKTSLTTLLTNYLQRSDDDFTRRFSGFILCNLLQSPHNCAYFLHLNHSFHYFATFPEDQMSLISLGYCFHRIMLDRYNRREFITRPSIKKLFLEKIKDLCQIGSIECKEYIAMCLSDIAKESAENRYTPLFLLLCPCPS
jgi:hypothetical protein